MISEDALKLCDFVLDGDVVLVADAAGEFMIHTGWSPEKVADFFIHLKRDSINNEEAMKQLKEYLEPAKERWTEDAQGKMVRFPVDDTWHFTNRPLRFSHYLITGLEWLLIGEKQPPTMLRSPRRVWPPPRKKHEK